MQSTRTGNSPSRSASNTSRPALRAAPRPVDVEDWHPRHREDHLGRAWLGLSERDRSLLGWRAAGETLAQVGVRLAVTRERVRQLQVQAESTLLETFGADVASLRQEVAAVVGQHAAVPEPLIQQTLGTRATAALTPLLSALGFVTPQTWAGELTGWWSDTAEAVDASLRKLAAQAPFATDLHEQAARMGLPAGLPLQELFVSKRSPLVPAPALIGGWTRRSAKGRDSAFLWLNGQGEPRSSEAIAEAIGWPSLRGLRESLRRDQRFTQLRPEGSWALSSWTTTKDRAQYRSTDEAVAAILRERGPLTGNQLIAETIARHPVSARWIRLSLSNSQVGRTEDGRYDLVERGATGIEERAPTRPTNMVESLDGQTLTIRLRVTPDVLRGSGIPVSRWLTWRVGLREVPSQRNFVLSEHGGDVVLRRVTGASAISSLRAVARSLGLVSGCHMLIVIRAQQGTAEIRHGCTGGTCPARLQ
jgi:hypothetical protein